MSLLPVTGFLARSVAEPSASAADPPRHPTSQPPGPLSAAALARLRSHGLVHLRHAFPAEEAAAMRAHLWRAIEARHGAREHQRSSWTSPWFGLSGEGRAPVFRAIASARMRAAVDQILGAGNWLVPRQWNMFLASPPDPPAVTPRHWRVPEAGWHADAAPHAKAGISCFILYAAMRPRGGGTLVVEGSHRLIARQLAARSATQRAMPWRDWWSGLKASHPWLAGLHGLQPGRSRRGLEFLRWASDGDGIPLRVVEITGEPGDIILWHPWMLHCRPSQHLGAPRLFSNKNIPPLRPVDLVAALPP